MDPDPEPIGLYALSYYLQRIRTFIESDKNTLSFPNISSNLQDVLVKIVTSDNTEFLTRLSNNDNVKIEAEKLTTVKAESKVKLIHDFCDGKLGPNVLMYKKVTESTVKAPEPLRKPREISTKSNDEAPSESLVTPQFKTWCLNITIKFIKDDTQLVLKYPLISPNQAEFVMSILLQGNEDKSESMDVGFGFKSIYAALWESMKINKLYYDYKIECLPTALAELKLILFEKIPKNTVVEKQDLNVPHTSEVNLSSTSSSISSNISAEYSKPIQKQTKFKEVQDCTININHSTSTSITSRNVETLPRESQNIDEGPQSNNKSGNSLLSATGSLKSRLLAGNQKLKSEKKAKQEQDKMRKKIVQTFNKLGSMIQNRNITEEFIEDSLQQISDFLFDEQLASLPFIQMESQKQFFLKSVERLCKDERTYMLFTGTCQKLLGNIKYCISKNIIYQTKLVKNYGKRNTVRDVIFEKLANFPTIGSKTEINESNNVDLSIQLTAPISQDVKEKLIRFEAIIDDVVQTSGESYISDCLHKISKFLMTDKSTLEFRCSTNGQALFIKYVHVLSNCQESYSMFSEGCQDLLRQIKKDACQYKLSFRWTIDGENETNEQTKIVIKKKLIGKKKGAMHRSRSLSVGKKDKRNADTASEAKPKPRGTSNQRTLTSKQILLEGLKQPVQSDKAMKMMQNMGWTGGALGLRGEGIMEPIMPKIDPGNRAGFGHVQNPKKVVEKSRKPNPEAVKPVSSQQSTSELFPQGLVPISTLLPSLIPPGRLSALTSDSQVKTVNLDANYHIGALRAIFEMVTTNIGVTVFTYVAQQVTFSKVANFIKHAASVYNYRKQIGLSNEDQNALVEKTLEALKKFKNLKFDTVVHRETVILRKLTNEDTFENLMETTDDQEPQLTKNQVSQLSENVSHRQWYPSINTFKYETQNKATHVKLPEKLNPILEKITMKPKAILTQNALMPPDLERVIFYYDLNIPRDVLITEEMVTIVQQSEEVKSIAPELKRPGLNFARDLPADIQVSKKIKTTNILIEQTAETTIAQNDQGTTTTIAQIPVRVTTMNTQTPQQLTTDSAVKLIEIKRYVWLEKSCSANNNHLTQNKNTPETVNEENIANDYNSTVTKNTTSADKRLTSNVTAVTKEKHVIDYIDLTDDAIQQTDGKSSTKIDKNITNNKKKLKEKANTHNNENQTLKINSDKTKQTENNIVPFSATSKTIEIEQDNLNAKDSVTYIIPIEYQRIVESNKISTRTYEGDLINRDKIVSNTNLNDNAYRTDKCKHEKSTNSDKNEMDSLLDYESVCEIMVDDFSTKIDINTKDEDDFLVSEIEVEPKKDLAIKITNLPVSQRREDTLTVLENTIQSDPIEVNVKDKKHDLATLQVRKRPSLSSPDSDPTKKCKHLIDYKKLYILHKDHPITKIDNNMACNVQTAILKVIDYKKDELPLLNCKGIHNGALIYSCSDEKSVLFMEDLIEMTEDLRVVYEFDETDKLSYKMAFRLNTFIEEPISKILSRLEIYNSGLSATKWNLIKKEQYCDYIVIYVEIDESSFNYVCNANFVLYAGNDCAKFTILWT